MSGFVNHKLAETVEGDNHIYDDTQFRTCDFEVTDTGVRMTNTTDRKYRPLVYICSPNSGDTEVNIKKARDFCRYALDQGQIPLAPHLMFPQFMKDADPDERELTMNSWWLSSSRG